MFFFFKAFSEYLYSYVFLLLLSNPHSIVMRLDNIYLLNVRLLTLPIRAYKCSAAVA